MRRAYFITGLIALLLAVWVLQGMDWRAVWAALSGLTPISLMVLLSVDAALTLLFSARWWLILRSQGYAVPYLSLAAYRLAGFGVSYFTPGTQFGGEPLQVYLLHQRQSVPAASALASVTFDKLLELLSNFVFLILGMAAIALGGLPYGFSPALTFSVVGLLFVLLAAYTAALWLEYTPLGWLLRRVGGLANHRLLQRWPRLPSGLQPISQMLMAAERQISMLCRQQARLTLLASGLSALVWAAVMFEFWLCLRFFGTPASALQAISLLTVARLTFLAPLPGALGVFEAGQVMAFQTLGFPAATAIALSLFIRARDVSLGLCGLALGVRLATQKRIHNHTLGFNHPIRMDR